MLTVSIISSAMFYVTNIFSSEIYYSPLQSNEQCFIWSVRTGLDCIVLAKLSNASLDSKSDLHVQSLSLRMCVVST